MSHVTWTFPGVKASGMKPFDVEWCDGFGNVAYRLEPKFMPPAFLKDIAARSPMKVLPPQGRVGLAALDALQRRPVLRNAGRLDSAAGSDGERGAVALPRVRKLLSVGRKD